MANNLALLTSLLTGSVGADSRLAIRAPVWSQYFPDSGLVLEMAKLSQAVYRLKDKVQSCDDVIAMNDEIILMRMQQGNNNFDEELDGTPLSSTLQPKEDWDSTFGLEGDQSDGEDLFQLLLPTGAECLHYSHDYSLGTQVLIVRSHPRSYVVVSYAGTDDWKTAVQDGDILTDSFGPGDSTNSIHNNSIFQRVPEEVRVHRGFNQAVFQNENYQKITECVDLARLGGYCDGRSETEQLSQPLQLLSTGHSLGAANSVLLGAALHLAYPTDSVISINFGCPRIGNLPWQSWINSLQPDKIPGKGSLEVFRFVNKIDIVPRLPALTFYHAGHTLQMSIGGPVRAYYDHVGDSVLGFSSVPFGWGEKPYALLPFALVQHFCWSYVKYLEYYQPKSMSTSTLVYYVNAFEREVGLEQEEMSIG